VDTAESSSVIVAVPRGGPGGAAPRDNGLPIPLAWSAALGAERSEASIELAEEVRRTSERDH
jgi:hypothetical protein